MSARRCLAGAWSDVEEEPGGPARLRVLTLNTWFDDYQRNARMRAQLALFEELKPDVIALQEVTSDGLLWLEHSSWIQAHYAMPSRASVPLADAGYGVTLCVRGPVQSFEYHPLPSGMGRGVLVADLGGGVGIGTVHLESMRFNGDLRALQLEHCQRVLDRHAIALLVGDFNFCSTSKEESGLRAPWNDVWMVKDSHGWTVDTVVNEMRVVEGDGLKQRRYDRVVMRDRTRSWRIVDVKLVGTEPIAPSVWVSDHFGVLAELRRG